MATTRKQDKYLEALAAARIPKEIKASLKAEVESDEFMLSNLSHFRDLDKDGNHILDRTEVKAAFAEMLADAGKDHKLSAVDIGRLFAEFDEDRSGTFSFTEYLELAQYVYVAIGIDQSDAVVDLLSAKRRATSTAARTERMLAASHLSEEKRAEIKAHINSPEFRKEFATKFDEFDKDGDGRMDTTELAIALSRVGRKASVEITKHSVDVAMSEYDADGNGVLGKGEFIEMCKMLYVSKECGDVRADGIGRFSSEATSERNAELAHKAFDVLATVINKKEADRAERNKGYAMTALGVVAVVAAAAVTVLRLRRK